MADITLTVDVSSLADANKKLQNFGAAVSKFSVLNLSRGINSLQNNIRELVSAQNAGTIGSSAYQLGLLQIKRAYEQMGYSSQAATAAVRKYAAEIQRQEATRVAEQAARALARAQQEAAAAAQRLADRQRELRVRFQEGYALFERQRQAMRDLREAYRANIITLQQYQAQLAQIRAGNFGQHMNQQAQGMSRFGLITQQAGYQVGDFFVQVQSGTNVLVAFGQQATQLIGTFATLATSVKAIAIFSGLAVLVSIGTAIGAYFMRASGASKTLKDSLSDLKEVSSSLKENFKLLKQEGLDLTFGDMTSSVKSLTSALLELDAQAEMRRLELLLTKVEEAGKPGFFKRMAVQFAIGKAGLSSTEGEGAAFASQINEEAYQKLGYSMARAQFEAYQKEMMALAQAGDRQGVVTLIEKMVNDATDFGQTADNVTEQGYQLIVQLAAAGKAIAESNALLNGSAEGAERLVELEKRKLEYLNLYNERLAEQNALSKERDAAVQNIIQARDNELAQLQQQKELLNAIYTYGADSAEVKALEAQQARDLYEKERMREGTLGNNLRIVMEEYDAVAAIRSEIEASAVETKLLANGMSQAAIDTLKLAGVDITSGISSAAAAAAELAASMNIALSDAFSIMNLQSSLTYSGRGSDPRDFMAGGEKSYSENFRPFSYEPSKNGGGGGGGAVQEDALQKLREQLALENELLGVSEAQKRVIQALGEQRSQYSEAEINAITAEIEAYNQKLEALKQQEQLAKVMQSSMEDAFMSIIDGTMSAKDAFKKMAYDMIKELYRVLVVQRLVGSFQSGGGGILGAVFKGLGGRESGGSVMAGQPYMVGERGPELVIPRHSGTVMNANLTRQAASGGGDVIVTNNINVPAGADSASIRAEVSKMIPQITQITKAAVIDAKQRGGQMSAAFR